MKLIFIAWLLRLASGLATGNTNTIIDVSKDATVTYSTTALGASTIDVLAPKGQQNILVASPEADSVYSRILLAFNLPSSVVNPKAITNCTLLVPVPQHVPEEKYQLTVYAAEDSWEEATVNGSTRVKTYKMLGSVQANAGAMPDDIDILQACRAASERSFGVVIDSTKTIFFNARESGSHQVFSVGVIY
ncbi:hypothetical protein GGI05_001230 [Coemansia sp. RSA 2603]|nr:hypothetical protein GGI05_001230 [Coemansia sp. RSA 2603]